MNRLAVFSLLFCVMPVFAQKMELQLLYEIEKPHHLIWTDNLQNLYIIDDSTIEMVAPEGEVKYQNSQLNLGRITSVDFNFSLKPMVFYQLQNTIVILDNTLSMQGNPVRLSEHNLNWVSAAAKSIDNHYWLFDLQNFELIRTDNSFKRVRSSGNISQMLQQNIQPNFMVEYDSWVYVNNPETGILVFDIFGTYFKQIPILGLKHFQINERYITYFADQQLHRYDLLTFDTVQLSLPVGLATDARLVKDLLFISTETGVHVFRVI